MQIFLILLIGQGYGADDLKCGITDRSNFPMALVNLLILKVLQHWSVKLIGL